MISLPLGCEVLSHHVKVVAFTRFPALAYSFSDFILNLCSYSGVIIPQEQKEKSPQWSTVRYIQNIQYDMKNYIYNITSAFRKQYNSATMKPCENMYNLLMCYLYKWKFS